MKRIVQWIPNLLTISNLTAGVIGILFWQHNILISAYCVLFAMLFDFLDGFSARMLKATSELGKQLDSLSDIVSFGILPACILFGVLHPDLIWMNLSEVPLVSFAVICVPICSALRLANFNIDDRQKSGFRGLPTPANAFWIASIPFILNQVPVESFTFSIFSDRISIVLMAIAGSALLLIPVPLMALKFKNINLKDNLFRYVFLLVSIVLFILLKWTAIPFIILTYVLISVSEVYIFRNRINSNPDK